MVLVLAGWVLVGLGVALVMIRRGHDVVIWLVLGVATGPFAIALAGLGAYLERQAPAPAAERTVSEATVGTAEEAGAAASGVAPTGRIRILAGIDGSDAANRAVLAAATLLGTALRSVTLLTILDYDTAFGASAARLDRITGETQAAAARSLSALGVRTLSARAIGGAAEQIVLRAASGDCDLIVLGAHRRRQSPLGSVTNRVAEKAQAPLLIIPPVPLSTAMTAGTKRTKTDATGLGIRENTP